MPHNKKAFDWCTQVRQAGVVKITQALGGIHTVRDGRGGLSPCPSCGAEVRSASTNDKRGPIGLTRDGGGWCCHRCNAHGDAVTLASWLSGQQGHINDRVGLACTNSGLVNATHASPPQVSPDRSRPTTPKYPPKDELSALLREAYAIDYAPEPSMYSWLATRGLDIKVLASLGCVLALPDVAPVPKWARMRSRPWPLAGYRLIAPLCDHTGTLRSVHARATATLEDGFPKGANPSGYDIRGLILACPRARTLLAGKCSPEHGIIIAEGMPDWLSWISLAHQQQRDIAVFGIMAGGWTGELADRIPDRTKVAVATHADKAGEQYAANIAKTFQSRTGVGRIHISKAVFEEKRNG